jgi:3-hydroxyacyl-CoA dehydrogenase/enoyl-CoA hydratase/3-hydroxybutyryl-CoA epimerase
MVEIPAIDEAALTLAVDGDGVASLVFDRADSKVNLLTSGVLARLDELLGEIERLAAEGSVRAVLVRSGKPGTFIAGADVAEIASIATEQEGYEASREGQRIFARLENLSVPTVVAIDGLCLGGATELILACGYRLASDRGSTRIGLPEVRLGIIPGFGGTTRLPRLIGLSAALPMILTGQSVNARKAHRIGLIEEAVPTPVLYDRARAVARGAVKPKPRGRALSTRLIDETFPGRRLALQQARKKVMKETRGLYPAPLAALDVIGNSIAAPLGRAFENEARALGRLIVTDVCRNLVRVFHLLESAKKSGPRATPRRVDRVAVLGAGVMGGGIAHLLASKDQYVRLKDIRTEAIASGLEHARGLFDRTARRGRMERRDIERRMNLIAPTLDYSGFGNIDLVIEAVVERMEVKNAVLRETEQKVPADAILTTNTSSLSVTTMQAALERPENFCGMHFFNPVHRMPLVEVVRGPKTSDVTLATVLAVTRHLEKTPVIVNDGPGFLVNRVLGPYLNEAGWLLAEGAGVTAIDRVLLEWGMPMGPLRLLDEIGLDVARHAAATLHEAFGDRMAPAAPLAALEQTNLLGRKGGKGFYIYEEGKEKGVNEGIYAALGTAVPANRKAIPPDQVRDRTALAMVNEAARTLEDGIAETPADVDLAMITGTGFPPFRGGLLRWADTLGMPTILARLDGLRREHGPRFEAAALIRERAASRLGFYD